MFWFLLLFYLLLLLLHVFNLRLFLWSFSFDLTNAKKHIKNNSWSHKISGTALDLGVFGTLFFFTNHLKLVNLIPVNDIYKWNAKKLSIHGSSKVPKHCKCIAIFGDLHRAKIICTDFSTEVTYIINKFWTTGYMLEFIKWYSEWFY